MKRTIKLNLTHLFLPIATLFIVLMFMFRDSTRVQMEIVAIGALIYVGIAFIHHHLDKTLTFEVIVEYILIAALTLIILQQFLI